MAACSYLLFLLALASGCAVKTLANNARLAIPVSCIDRVVSGFKDETLCADLPKDSPNAPDLAKCNNVVIQYHCTKVQKEGK